MDLELAKEIAEKANTELDLSVPFWAKIILFFLKFIPGIPGWVTLLLPIVIGLIDKLPLRERRQARKELVSAAMEAAKTKDTEALKPVFKRHCEGSVCWPVRTDDTRF